MSSSSGYPGEFIPSNLTNTRGVGISNTRQATIGGNINGTIPYNSFRLQGGGGGAIAMQDEINQRRVDLLMGKRSYGDYQSYQHQLHILQHHQQQQQPQPLSYLQKLQQHHQSTQQMSLLLQNHNLLRSVKQRTNNNININNNNNGFSNNNINQFDNCLTRFGVPVYQQTRQQLQPQLQQHVVPSFNQNYPQLNINNNNNQIINPVQSVGYSGSSSGSGTGKKMFTLQELEKQLLDDDDDFVINLDQDADAISGVTNSDWSETFQSLLVPSPSLSPSLSQSPNTVNVANVISPSPTSSTSSCCSTTAPATSSPPLQAVTTTAVTPATPATVSTKQLVSDIAAAVSDGKNDVASDLLTRLEQIGNIGGNSEQRLAYYMCHALRSRACPDEKTTPVTELFSTEQVSAVYSLYDISPCFKFALLAANLVMLEGITASMQEGLKIHIIDFDVGHGAQYVNLLRALAERRSRVPCPGMKITVVETECSTHGGVQESVRDGLVSLAERVGVKLSYSCVTRAIHELTRESLGVDSDESVVVNFAFKVYRVPDESVSMENLRDELLRRVKGLSPRAVTLVEQDMNGNTASFNSRVTEVCDYYGALFDSLEVTLPRENQDRCRVEKGLGRKMVNSVACEGRERVERAEVFGKWRARMGMAGFELKPLNQTVAESMRAKLDSSRGGNPGFTVKEENGGVGFGWMGRSLTVASAWR